MPDLADRPVFGMGAVGTESRRRPRVGIAVAAVVIAAFIAGIWYVYDRGVRRGDLKALPVIAADSGPIKSAPIDAGGLKVPHVDGEMPRTAAGRAGKIEDILPPPERPVYERPKPEPAPPAAALAPTEPAQVAKVEPEPPPPAATADIAPRAAPSTPAAAAPPAPAAKEALSAAPEQTDPPASAQPAVPEKPAPTVATVAPAAGQSAGAGAFRIQLVSVGEQKAAEGEWRRLSKANADVLGKLSPSVVKVDLPGKGTFHRLSAGPFPDRGAATQACETLHKRKVGCFVVAP